MIWETEFVVNETPHLAGRGVWVFRRSWDYFLVNGKWYRNPVYVSLYYSESLEGA